MTSAYEAGRPTAGYLGNLKGAYTESLAKSDIAGNTIIDLKHINKGGIDYAAKEGNTLKIVEAKARSSLSRADIENYIKPSRTGDLSFNANYAVKELGENYFKDPSTQKQFILYLNSPNSLAIKKSLNLPSSVPFTLETKTGKFTGTVEVFVMAMNK